MALNASFTLSVSYKNNDGWLTHSQLKIPNGERKKTSSFGTVSLRARRRLATGGQRAQLDPAPRSAGLRPGKCGEDLRTAPDRRSALRQASRVGGSVKRVPGPKTDRLSALTFAGVQLNFPTFYVY